VAEDVLRIGEVLSGRDHITIKLWSKVVVGVLGWVVPFSLGSISSHFKIMTESTLRDFEGVVGLKDFVINSEVWDWVVDVVATCLLLVLVLGATGGGADWVGLKVQINSRLNVSHLMT